MSGFMGRVQGAIENMNERERKLPFAKAVMNELQTRTEKKLEQEIKIATT